MFLGSCTYQKPFQSALVSVVGKVKEKQTQLMQPPVRQMIVITGSMAGFVSSFKFSLASSFGLDRSKGGRETVSQVL